jgi:hypothetical protein
MALGTAVRTIPAAEIQALMGHVVKNYSADQPFRMTGPRRILVRDMGPNYRDSCWPWRYVAVVSDDERWFGSDDSIDGAVADLRRQSPDFAALPVDPRTYGPGADDRCDGR